MSFLFVSADSKHREKIEEFLKSFPQDEVDFISGDDDGALDFNNEETFSIKKYTEEQRKAKLTIIF